MRKAVCLSSISSKWLKPQPYGNLSSGFQARRWAAKQAGLNAPTLWKAKLWLPSQKVGCKASWSKMLQPYGKLSSGFQARRWAKPGGQSALSLYCKVVSSPKPSILSLIITKTLIMLLLPFMSMSIVILFLGVLINLFFSNL